MASPNSDLPYRASLSVADRPLLQECPLIALGPSGCRFESDEQIAEAFEDPRVGFAYQGAIFSGDRFEAADPHPDLLWRDCPTLGPVAFRSCALELLPEEDLRVYGLGDIWRLTRQVSRLGWKGVKLPGMSLGEDLPEPPCGGYFDFAQLRREPVTVFCPLSGRRDLWTRFSQMLEGLQWHSSTSLVLLDTSQNYKFSREVRRWLADNCAEQDVRHVELAVGSPGLSLKDRNSKEALVGEVQRAMCRIWGWLSRNLTNEFALILEDDVFPQDTNIIEKLMRGLNPHVDSVSAAYLSPYAEHHMAWDYQGAGFEFRRSPGEGLQKIGGNGFGCCLLRAAALRGFSFCSGPRAHSGSEFVDPDLAFYKHLSRQGRSARIDWRVKAEHVPRRKS